MIIHRLRSFGLLFIAYTLASFTVRSAGSMEGSATCLGPTLRLILIPHSMKGRLSCESTTASVIRALS
jgi:hypothetical protein